MNSLTNDTETSEANTKVTVFANVEIDLAAIASADLLDEMRRRGFSLSAYEFDTDHQTFVEQCAVQAFDILAMISNRQPNQAVKAIEDLIRDVLHELTPRNQTSALT